MNNDDYQGLTSFGGYFGTVKSNSSGDFSASEENEGYAFLSSLTYDDKGEVVHKESRHLTPCTGFYAWLAIAFMAVIYVLLLLLCYRSTYVQTLLLPILFGLFFIFRLKL